ncbi:hypothetical protein HDE_10233 [Halotydeus destructor]|nr:hypothetical protein HDE_10233 [Halotydeus destructor]
MAASKLNPENDEEFKAVMNEICLEYDLPRRNLYVIAQAFVREDAFSRFDDDPVAIVYFERYQDRIRQFLRRYDMQETDYVVRLRHMMKDSGIDEANSDPISGLLDPLKNVSGVESKITDAAKLRKIEDIEAKVYKARAELEKVNADHEAGLLELKRLKDMLCEANMKNKMADEMLLCWIKHNSVDGKDNDFNAMFSRFSSSQDVVE